MQRRDQDMSVAESLGAFVGAIWGGIKADPTRPAQAARTVSTRIEEREVDGLTLRRTIIDEVIVPPAADPTNDHRTNHATH